MNLEKNNLNSIIFNILNENKEKNNYSMIQ